MNKALHEKKDLPIDERPIFINGAEVTRPPRYSSGYIEELMKGGVTAGVKTLTFRYNENLVVALKSLVEYENVSPGRTLIATTVEDIRKAGKEGKYAIIAELQFPDPIGDDLELLEVLQRIGIRIFQLSYQRSSLFADGCGERRDGGLTALGVRAVEALNKNHMVIDLSHVSRKSSLEAIEISRDPVLFTHANLKAFCAHPRDKADDEIKALAEKGGVIGLTCLSPQIKQKGRATMADFLDRIDYVVNLVGVDHVGIGLDVAEHFTREGYEEDARTFPELYVGSTYETFWVDGLETASKWSNIERGLASQGYSHQDIAKILGENFLRVFKVVW